MYGNSIRFPRITATNYVGVAGKFTLVSVLCSTLNWCDAGSVIDKLLNL